MNHDSENFKELRCLIALKRHEQPPLGYFNNFSREVCARIRAGEQGSDARAFGWLFQEINWMQRFWAALETKPILAGAVGLASVVFLLGGVLYSADKADFGPQPLVPSPAVAASTGLSHSTRDSVFETPSLAGFQMNNNNFVSGSQGSLFPVQQVNFITQGN